MGINKRIASVMSRRRGRKSLNSKCSCSIPGQVTLGTIPSTIPSELGDELPSNGGTESHHDHVVNEMKSMNTMSVLDCPSSNKMSMMMTPGNNLMQSFIETKDKTICLNHHQKNTNKNNNQVEEEQEPIKTFSSSLKSSNEITTLLEANGQDNQEQPSNHYLSCNNSCNDSCNDNCNDSCNDNCNGSCNDSCKDSCNDSCKDGWNENEKDGIHGVQTHSLDIGYFSMEGRHHMNEDRLIVHLDGNFSFLAVIDGHGGSVAADYVKSHLVQAILDGLDDEPPTSLSLRKIVMEFDRMYCSLAKKQKDTSGACFVAVLFWNNEAFVINLGDCRAIQFASSRKKNPKSTIEGLDIQTLTTDHKSSSAKESKRIHQAGGFVRAGRLAGVLEPSRAIGDVDLKGEGMRGWVIADPDIRVALLEKNTVVLLATDGLWDVLSTRKAAVQTCETLLLHKTKNNFSETVLNKKKNHSQFTDNNNISIPATMATAALSLCRTASALGSDDDISAIVIRCR